jgi:thiol-disulfide isomerase/thioredoxin
MLSGCQLLKRNDVGEQFYKEFSDIQTFYAQKLNREIPLKERNALLKAKESALEKLLNAYGSKDTGGKVQLVKAYVLIDLSRFREAASIADRLIKGKSDLKNDARMLKVQALLGLKQIEQAFELFKKLDPRPETGKLLWNSWLYFALFSQDSGVVEEYGKKFLEVKDLPDSLLSYKSRVLQNLSWAARIKNNYDEARRLLEQAVATASDETLKTILTADLERMELLDKPASTIAGDSWLNSSPLDISALKGKPVILLFWAPWCDSCGRLIPALNKIYGNTDTNNESMNESIKENMKEKEFHLIGCTRLYGKAGTGTQNVEYYLEKNDELERLAEFVEQKEVKFPVSISTEGFPFDNYKINVIPSLIFIDKDGVVKDFYSGFVSSFWLKNRIKTLLEVTDGKD